MNDGTYDDLRCHTCGIYDGITRAVYERWPAVNHSRLRLFQHPPAKAKYLMENPPEPTEAYQLGTATHTAILEPEQFETDWIAGLGISRRSKADQKAWEDFEQANSDKLILPADDYEMCAAMRDSVWTQDSLVRSILQSDGQNERSFVWTDAETGLLCKGRCDGMRRWSGGWTVVFDLKTARSAALDEFSRDIAKYSYATQAAFYLDGLAALADVPRRWLWLVLEKEPPYLHAIYEPEDRLLEQGRRTYRRWLEAYKTATETDTWPGYPSGILPVDVPRWAQDGSFVEGI